MYDNQEVINAKRHGGKREGSGRKTRAEENKLMDKLNPLDSIAFKALENGVKNGEFNFVRMYFEYRFGKPKERMDITTAGQKIGAIQVEIIERQITGPDQRGIPPLKGIEETDNS